jgi:hypothetical protein
MWSFLLAIPTNYLTSSKNLEGIFNAIRGAQAPERFTNSFLEQLEFKSSSDRLIISMLKALGFLDADGRPKERYFQYLDQTRSETIMATAIREAYSDLFQVNTKAHELSRVDVKNKLKTLTQGQVKESVLDKMAMTFVALVPHGDFSAPSTETPKTSSEKISVGTHESIAEVPVQTGQSGGSLFGGLHYNIQINLPTTRDTKVYDSIFKSLKEHLSD